MTDLNRSLSTALREAQLQRLESSLASKSVVKPESRFNNDQNEKKTARD